MTDEDAAKLQFELASPGWLEVHRPMLVSEVASTDQRLGLTLEERPSPRYSDDFLKGYRRGLLFAYQRVERLLAEHSAPRLEDLKEPPATGSPY